VNVENLADGQRACCPRCGGFLTQYRKDAFERAVALSIAALILLVVANLYDFLGFSASGLSNEISLRETPITLWEYDMKVVAIMVAAFIIYIPALALIMMVGLCVPLNTGRYYTWLNTLAKGIFICKNWAMVEVFIIGVIVSLVKIMAMATVTLGVSFWAYTGFALCFTFAMASLDRYQCWERLEQMEISVAVMQE
jgi:paraquat-inducible protein A